MGNVLKLYSPNSAERVIRRYDSRINEIAERYQLPSPFIRALLYTELIRIDLFDLIADLVVRVNLSRGASGGAGLLHKRDSSTGPGQIFGFVAINAANFAVDHGLAQYADLGLPERKLDPENAADLQLVWNRLNRDPEFNITMSALNLIAAAEEVTGRIDFPGYSPEEIQRVYTRYNGTVPNITPYGEEAYRNYLRYAGFA